MRKVVKIEKFIKDQSNKVRNTALLFLSQYFRNEKNKKLDFLNEKNFNFAAKKFLDYIINSIIYVK